MGCPVGGFDCVVVVDVGACVGAMVFEGAGVGELEGASVGAGVFEGAGVGKLEGAGVVGSVVGPAVGFAVGSAVGFAVGSAVTSTTVGANVKHGHTQSQCNVTLLQLHSH